MPIKMTPAEYAEKQARRLKGATDDIRRGVMAVTEAPTAKAAAKADKMLANLTQAVQSGKWARRLKAVGLEDWRTKTLEKGLNRIAQGIDSAYDKQVEFASQLLPFEATLQAKVEAMPDATLEDSISKMVEWCRGMAKFEKK